MIVSEQPKPPTPARTRLIVAAIVWAIFIGTGINFASSALGIADVWRVLISSALFLAVFIPLSLAAVRELYEARARGEAPPAPTPTRRAVIGWAIFTALFWVLTIWFLTSTGEYLFPLMPIISTIWLVVQVRRYRGAARSAGAARA